MNKKAVMDTLAIILIFVIAAFILLVFADDLADLFKGTTDIEICRLSVLAQAKTRTFLGVDSPKTIIPLECPRRILKVYENKVELNGKKTSEYDIKKLTADDVNHIVAEELRLCWWKMAEGKQNVFEESVLFGTDRTCLICAEVNFDEKLKGKYYNGINEYLRTKQIPESKITYFQYLVRDQNHPAAGIPWSQYTPLGSVQTGKIYESGFSSNEKYNIYFLAYKPPRALEFIGAYPSIYYIGLAKEEQIEKECDISVN